MDIAQIAAVQVANSVGMARQTASVAMVKKQAEAQMQMVQLIAQEVAQTKIQEGFSVYA